MEVQARMSDQTETYAKEIRELGLKRWMVQNYESITPGLAKYPVAYDAGKKLRAFLRTLPLELLFESGVPKRKPYFRRTHNTCKCQGCAFCRSVLIANAIKRIKEDRYPAKSLYT